MLEGDDTRTEFGRVDEAREHELRAGPRRVHLARGADVGDDLATLVRTAAANLHDPPRTSCSQVSAHILHAIVGDHLGGRADLLIRKAPDGAAPDSARMCLVEGDGLPA